MYSRNYYEENESSPKPPDNYNGTIFSGNDQQKEEPLNDIPEQKQEIMASKEVKQKGGLFSSFPKSIPLPAFLKGFGLGSLSMPKLGTEEILIIAVAAYLFFTKEGDKECAIMLILLLFVS